MDLTQRSILVTGASSGIGAIAARVFAAQGADVIPVGRDPRRTEALAAELNVEPELCDFADLAQVRALAERLHRRTDRLDVVLHNAGALVPKRVTTVDGHELTFQANHLSPFLLQTLIADLLVPDARVVVTSSVAYLAGHIDLDDLDGERGRYLGFRRYGTSKLANVLFAAELARRGTTAVSVHPGVVNSNFGHDSLLVNLFYRGPFGRLTTITPEQGAEPLVALATRPDLNRFSGRYFQRSRPAPLLHPQARDAATALALWEASAVLIDRG